VLKRNLTDTRMARLPLVKWISLTSGWRVSLTRSRMSAANLDLQINRSEFPTLFAIAMDYLPIQASSVPCERVFSSAKDTDTVKRNRIHPMLMEVLQTMKFSLKKDRGAISFTDGWKTTEVEMMAAQKTSKEDLLAHFHTGDRQAITDTLLKVFDDELNDDN
jgi:hAT family C-terminal dimerisation region